MISTALRTRTADNRRHGGGSSALERAPPESSRLCCCATTEHDPGPGRRAVELLAERISRDPYRALAFLRARRVRPTSNVDRREACHDNHPRRDDLAELSAQGVAVWLDDLSREPLAGGQLKSLIADRHVVGITTNPTNFATALSDGDRYDEQLHELRARAPTLKPRSSPSRPRTFAAPVTSWLRCTSRPRAWTGAFPSRWTRG